MLFENIAGNDKIIDYLKRSIKENLVSHAYIFEGNDKEILYNTAIAYAQALLCKNFVQDSCNCCSDCIKSQTQNHPDIHVIFPDDKNSIKKDVIEKLICSIYTKSYEGGRKIYIIKDCDKMTISAANSFLKTLEEPTDGTVIMLLTNNSLKMIETISSRCQLLHFNNLKLDALQQYIINEHNISEYDAKIMAYYSNGSLTKAKDLIDGNDTIFKNRENIIEIFGKIIEKDKSVMYNYEKYFEQVKDDIEEYINVFMIWMRDLVLYNQGLNNLIVNIDCLEIIKYQAERYNTNKIGDYITCLQNVIDDIKYNVNYKLSIDNMILVLMEGVNK